MTIMHLTPASAVLMLEGTLQEAMKAQDVMSPRSTDVEHSGVQRYKRRANMGPVGGECDCSVSLAAALGGSAHPHDDRSEPVGVSETGVFCFWCGERSLDPEQADEARPVSSAPRR